MASAEAKSIGKKLRQESDGADPNKIVLDGKNGRKTAAGASTADINAVPLRQRGATDEQFPTTAYENQSEQDELMNLKLSLQDAANNPGQTIFGKLVASDSDFKWLQNKREGEAYANFEQWFCSNYDKMSVTEKAIARKLFPSFYASRLKLLDRQIALQRRIAELKIKGIESKEDLLFQYALEAGYVDAQPLSHILDPEGARLAKERAARIARYGRGLLNPKRLLRGDWGLASRAQNALSALRPNAAESQANADAVFGNDAAYKYGTTGFGFSAGGDLTAAQEGAAGSRQQRAFIEPLLA